MPKITVMMPVYNAEPFLDECMQSILSQTLSDIEVLCIDDGSKDNSGVMLDEYAAKDTRIRVIHKENTGYGHSMNLAIREATGDYVAIVEPDDYIRKDMFEILHQLATTNDIGEPLDFVKGNYSCVCKGSEPSPQEPFSKKYLSRKIITPRNHLITFHGAASIWSAIYRRKWLLEKNIQFLETPGASFQDTGFYITTIFEAEKGMFIREPLYFYRVDNINSSVKDNSKIFAIVDEFRALEERYAHDNKKRKILNSLKIEKYIWNFERLNNEGRDAFKDDYKTLIPVIQKHDYFLEITGTSALKYACKTLGINYSVSIRIESFILNIKKIIKKGIYLFRYK